MIENALSLVLIAIFGALAFSWSTRNSKKGRPPGVGIPDIIFLLWNFWHPNIAELMADVGKKRGPIVQVGFRSFQLLMLNGTDIVREASKHPHLNGRIDNMYKRVIGSTKGITWTDDSTVQRKVIFRHSKLLGLVGASAENIVHEEISHLFKHFDSFRGKAFSVKNIFNIPTLNSVAHLLFGEKIPHDDPELKSMVDRMAVLVEIKNPFMRFCVLAPKMTSWVPGWLSGWNFTQGVIDDSRKFFSPFITKHLKNRVPNQPRDFLDAIWDEVEATTDPESPLHASKDPVFQFMYDMLTGGIETSAAVLEWVILYLSHYPQVQEKLQAEVANVIGAERLPELSDRANMPYYQAFLQEMFRIAPVIPFGNHLALEDTQLGGYTIKKGTSIINNFYGIHKDPNLWDKPEELRPERFIDAEGKFVKSDQLFFFGFGRRDCVGEVTARDQLFLYISRIVQTYKLVPEKKLKTFTGAVGLGYHCCTFKTQFIRRD